MSNNENSFEKRAKKRTKTNQQNNKINDEKRKQ